MSNSLLRRKKEEIYLPYNADPVFKNITDVNKRSQVFRQEICTIQNSKYKMVDGSEKFIENYI